MKADFTITFAPDISRADAEKVVKALEDYYKACGGQDFEVTFQEEVQSEPSPVSQESEPFENFTREERTVKGGLVVTKGSEAPWLTSTGVGMVKVYGIRRCEGVVEFGIGNEEPSILGWVTADRFWPEFPD